MENYIETIVAVAMCLTKRYYKDQKGQKDPKQTLSKYILFDTAYCTFLLEDRGEIGYEGKIEWEYNPGSDKSCELFFETDDPVTPPEGGYAEFAKARSDSTGVTDLEIEKLVRVIPEFEEIRPGKCYHRLESILSDRKRIDTEIRQAIADHFLDRPELISENATRQDLMDGISISFIAVYRNGVTEFCIFDTEGIYVDDLQVNINEDGKREIHYKAVATSA